VNAPACEPSAKHGGMHEPVRAGALKMKKNSVGLVGISYFYIKINAL